MKTSQLQITFILTFQKCFMVFSMKLSDFVFVPNGLYHGNFTEYGAPEGQGLIIYDYPNKVYNYSGSWKNGKRHGQGTTYFRNGDMHEGLYKNDKAHGIGLKKYSNGDIFQGIYINGLRNGRGIFKFKDGTKRFGSWKSNILVGQGELHYPNGSIKIELWHDQQRKPGDFARSLTSWTIREIDEIKETHKNISKILLQKDQDRLLELFKNVQKIK